MNFITTTKVVDTVEFTGYSPHSDAVEGELPRRAWPCEADDLRRGRNSGEPVAEWRLAKAVTHYPTQATLLKSKGEKQ
jgi:hypothetical protein